jgi:predicted mannosyl-3-phosphoglycerate phosphatase (HAD superfamily)
MVYKLMVGVFPETLVSENGTKMGMSCHWQPWPGVAREATLTLSLMGLPHYPIQGLGNYY